MNPRRLFAHLFSSPWRLRRAFPARTLRAIEDQIRDSEKSHSGEIRFAVEATLDLPQILQGQSARARAIEVFSLLRVWDTGENNGVLIYLLLADRDVEIVADRGIHRQVQAEEWEAVCREMERAFRNGEFEAGALAGVRAVSQLLSKHFPGGGDNPNELSNQPVIL